MKEQERGEFMSRTMGAVTEFFLIRGEEGSKGEFKKPLDQFTCFRKGRGKR